MCSVDGKLHQLAEVGTMLTGTQVPLDYADPDGPKAGIAMVKVPSKVSADSAEYRGPILFNPGMFRIS